MSRSRRRRSGDGWTLVRTCPDCGEPESSCRCQPAEASRDAPPGVRLTLETRRGRPVTVLTATGMPETELRDLLRELRATCAAGGSAKGLRAELQGDHRETVRRRLTERGIRVQT